MLSRTQVSMIYVTIFVGVVVVAISSARIGYQAGKKAGRSECFCETTNDHVNRIERAGYEVSVMEKFGLRFVIPREPVRPPKREDE